MESAGIPVVTSCAFRIQDAYNALVAANEAKHNEDEENEDARHNKEFIAGELLKLAVNLDYADEIGRRKMFALVREYLSQVLKFAH